MKRSTGATEGTAINGLLSLSEVRRRLRPKHGLINVHYIKGFAEGMGICLQMSPPSVVMTEEDYTRFAKQFAKTKRVAVRAMAS
jgi:hypothetical protein